MRDTDGNNYVWDADKALHHQIVDSGLDIKGPMWQPEKDVYSSGTFKEMFDKPLPMDTPARMKRAEEMGFDTDVFHGTGRQFEEFQINPSQRAAGSDKEPAVFFTKSPIEANHFARVAGATAHGENVIPAKIRGNFKDVDAPYYRTQIFSDELAAAKKEGFDGVRFIGVDEGTGPADQYAVFNPANIRSRHAAFDPAKKDSANLLAGVAGGGLAVNIGLAQRDNKTQ
jgi:hypothetical protein